MFVTLYYGYRLRRCPERGTFNSRAINVEIDQTALLGYCRSPFIGL